MELRHERHPCVESILRACFSVSGKPPERAAMRALIGLGVTLIGAFLLVAPLLFSFLLAIFNRTGLVNGDDRVSCSFAGSVVLIIGIILDILAFRAAGRAPIKRIDCGTSS